MRNNKILLYVFMIPIILAACVCMRFETKEPQLHFLVYSDTDRSAEQITCWISEDDKYYVFLPGYAGLEQMQVQMPEDYQIKIDQVPLSNGMSCGVFELNEEYSLTYSSWGNTYQNSIIFLKSGNVSTMHIDTQSESMEYIHENKENEESGTVRVYTDAGELDYEGAFESLSGRGNNTWNEFEKKPYNLKFTQEENLLGMGHAQKWILLANASDSSNMRNKIVFEFADKFGLMYSPDSTWVDLYLNGRYAGLYLLCERNEVNSQRIAIGEPGSILVSQELESRLIAQEYPYVSTLLEQTFRVHYPTIPTDQIMDEIQQTMQSVENAIIAEDGNDPVTGKSWQQLIDLDTWARKYLVEEVFGNMDASYVSQYFYIDGTSQSGKVFAGPVWDYDLSMGNKHSWQLSSPYIMLANRLQVRDGIDTPWFNTLYQNNVFLKRVKELFEDEVLVLMDQLQSTELDSYTGQIAKAAAMNQIRWPNETESIETEVAYIREYLTSRTDFLKSLWFDNLQYHLVRADNSFGSNYAYYVVRDGACLVRPPALEDTKTEYFAGWYYTDTHEPFDASKAICEDTELYAKWEETPSKRIGQIVKLIPLGIIAVMGVVLLAADIKRMIKSR